MRKTFWLRTTALHTLRAVAAVGCCEIDVCVWRQPPSKAVVANAFGTRLPVQNISAADAQHPGVAANCCCAQLVHSKHAASVRSTEAPCQQLRINLGRLGALICEQAHW